MEAAKIEEAYVEEVGRKGKEEGLKIWKRKAAVLVPMGLKVATFSEYIGVCKRTIESTIDVLRKLYYNIII